MAYVPQQVSGLSRNSGAIVVSVSCVVFLFVTFGESSSHLRFGGELVEFKRHLFQRRQASDGPIHRGRRWASGQVLGPYVLLIWHKCRSTISRVVQYFFVCHWVILRLCFFVFGSSEIKQQRSSRSVIALGRSVHTLQVW